MEETKNNTKKQCHTFQQEEEDNAKWVTHYSRDHQILLVGEGDFSFSLSLAKVFGSAANIVASSLNSYDDVIKMYKNSKSNLEDLHKLGACLLHGVDATKMKLHSDLKMRRFDRVIFNFPHAGFYGKENNILLIKMHKALVLGFFKNANGMLRANGEIHVSHKTTAPFTNWKIEKLAAQCFLTLIECADFKREDYPGYNNKRGDGYRCDEPFPLGKCCTYKFIYIPKTRRKHKKRKRMLVSRRQTYLPLQKDEDAVEQLPTSVHLNYYPPTSHFPKMNETMTSIFDLSNRHTSITGGQYVAKVHGRGAPSGGYSALGISLGLPRTLQSKEPLQSLQPWPPSTNIRYSLTEHVRTMDIVPLSLDARNEGHRICVGRSNYLQQLGRTMDTVPLSLGARNDGYQVYGGRSNCFQDQFGRTTAHRTGYSFDGNTNVGYSAGDPFRSIDAVPLSPGARNEGHYQVYGSCSNYWQEEHGNGSTTVQRACYAFDGVSSDFERYIAQEPARTVQSELHRMNISIPERRVFVES